MLCVSELATNAVLHGVPAGREFCVRLSATSELVRLEVRDSGPGRPTIQLHDESACSGRGLRIVNELADEFDVTDHVVGKTVWVIFKSAAAAAPPAGNT
ncbi:ATP-binding protein [Streptomyces sp. M10(2022)]